MVLWNRECHSKVEGFEFGWTAAHYITAKAHNGIFSHCSHSFEFRHSIRALINGARCQLYAVIVVKILKTTLHFQRHVSDSVSWLNTCNHDVR